MDAPPSPLPPLPPLPPIALPAFEPGTVWLAGAGPGDPGLLTLQVAHALRLADAVLYDDLVGEGVLALAAPGCRLESAGRRAGRPSPTQAEVSARLVQLAQAGLRVLRLKGGDPFVFGRGAEEGLVLAAAGVPFRVLPGVSAGVGGLAYAGIPLTHRDTNAAVTFVTGQGAGGGLPVGVDWAALARGSPVLVVYMGLATLPQLTAALLDAGRDAEEPVAVVSRATLPGQRVLESTLGRVAGEAAGMPAPALVVVGQVVRLRGVLDWLRPLSTAGARYAEGREDAMATESQPPAREHEHEALTHSHAHTHPDGTTHSHAHTHEHVQHVHPGGAAPHAHEAPPEAQPAPPAQHGGTPHPHPHPDAGGSPPGR